MIHMQDIDQFSGLETLDLSEQGLQDNNLLLLAKHRTLRQLYLDMNPISDRGLTYLRTIRSLEVLSLSYTKITDPSLAALRHLDNLGQLRLTGTAIGDAGPAALSQMRLQILMLDRTAVSDAGLAYLRRLFLTRLSLQDTQVRGSGLVHLRNSTLLREIRPSHFESTHLVHMRHFTGLITLFITNSTLVTDTGIGALAGLSKLEELNLEETSVTPGGIQHLVSALPHITIRYEP